MDLLLKEGSLFLQGLKFGKRIWRKIWVRVFKSSEVGIGRIEMYDVREGAGITAKLKKGEKRVIRLTECLSVTPALVDSCPSNCTAFYLNTTHRIYTLAAPTDDEWVPALCSMVFQCSEERGGQDRKELEDGVHVDLPMTENNIYSSFSPGQFQVTMGSSEASVRCCLFGSYLLSPEKESLCLLDMKTGQVVFLWPYRSLRRFGQVKEGVTIEAGRQCQTGEGLFIFLSRQGQQIYRAIEEAIMHQRVQDLLSEATALPSPEIGITRRNLALPPLPGPKPSALTSQPDLHAKVKPVPKPRNIPPPPPAALSKPKLMETKPNGLNISDDWNQNAHLKQDTSEHQLYSKIKPRLHPGGRKPDAKNKDPAESQQSPVLEDKPKIPNTFKDILSNVLFKDMPRTVPPSEPRSYSDLLSDPDYYEIQ